RSLRQVLLNLLMNGANACRAAGKPVRLGIDVLADGDRVQLIVKDRGPGLSTRELQRVFEPFYTTHSDGSGLGLYLSRELVQQMGGSLTITSDKESGTRVTIALPRKPEK
ncbi:MAG: ATP-binding protein, partial [candidate division Zixibacteria bacterium]|nr:ATP-binding protein [candidate division Zixibacteria bacterium]